MKNKLVYSNFDPETGISTVTIQNKYGRFTGTAKLDEEDRKHPSKFQGCEYAEMKAVIAFLEERIKIYKLQIKALQDCYQEMMQSSHFNKSSYEATFVKKYAFKYYREITELRQEIAKLQIRMEKTIAERAISAKHLDKHRSKLQLKGKED